MLPLIACSRRQGHQQQLLPLACELRATLRVRTPAMMPPRCLAAQPTEGARYGECTGMDIHTYEQRVHRHRVSTRMRKERTEGRVHSISALCLRTCVCSCTCSCCHLLSKLSVAGRAGTEKRVHTQRGVLSLCPNACCCVCCCYPKLSKLSNLESAVKVGGQLLAP